MNNRIKELRKNLGLNQTEFGLKIGITQTGVTALEKPGRTVTDQNVKSICREFGVSEAWLRHGTGNMFEDRKTVSALDALAEQYDMNYIERAALEAYLSSSPAVRQAITIYFSQLTAQLQQAEEEMQTNASGTAPADSAEGAG